MRSEELVSELGAIIRRCELRINSSPRWAAILEQEFEAQSTERALTALEDAIATLVMLHIQIRKRSV